MLVLGQYRGSGESKCYAAHFIHKVLFVLGFLFQRGSELESSSLLHLKLIKSIILVHAGIKCIVWCTGIREAYSPNSPTPDSHDWKLEDGSRSPSPSCSEGA
jgi:hypothetical protein